MIHIRLEKSGDWEKVIFYDNEEVIDDTLEDHRIDAKDLLEKMQSLDIIGPIDVAYFAED